MDKKSAIKGKRALAANNASKPLKKAKRSRLDDSKKHKKNVIEKQRSDTEEGLADRLQKIEEKLDLLISLISSKPEASAAVKTGPVKAGTESNSSSDDDESSSDDDESSSAEEPSKKKDKVDAKIINDVSSEESDDEKDPYRHGLFVGDRFAGGRCGGRGFCGYC